MIAVQLKFRIVILVFSAEEKLELPLSNLRFAHEASLLPKQIASGSMYESLHCPSLNINQVISLLTWSQDEWEFVSIEAWQRTLPELVRVAFNGVIDDVHLVFEIMQDQEVLVGKVNQHLVFRVFTYSVDNLIYEKQALRSLHVNNKLHLIHIESALSNQSLSVRFPRLLLSIKDVAYFKPISFYIKSKLVTSFAA